MSSSLYRTKLRSAQTPTTKRTATTAAEEPTTKKPKPATKPSRPEFPPNLQLSISTLVWQGDPTVWCGDGEMPEMYGGYIQDPTAAGKLGSPAWSARRDCFVLKPANPYKFLYKRARYCEQDVAGFEEYHAIFGDGDDVLPLIFIHRSSNRTPCIASTTDERWRKKAVCRSPYKFFTGAPDEAAVPWESFQYESSSTYIPIPEPDLELHQRAEDTGDGAESDPEPENAEESWWGPWKGWSGDWTRKFIERDRQRMPLESLDKIIWGYHDKTKTCTWGVKLRLIPQQGKVASKTWYYDNDDGSQNDEGDDDEDEDEEGYTKERLVSYIVLATVLEVYVKSDLLTLDVL